MGFLSTVLLLWCAPVVRKSLRSAPQASDVPLLPDGLHPRSAPCAHAKELIHKRSLLYTVNACYPGILLVGSLCSIMHGALTTVIRTLIVRQLIASPELNAEAVCYIVALGLCLCLEGLSTVGSRHWIADRFAYAFFSLVSLLLQRKTLRLSSSTSAASVHALVGNDLVKCMEHFKTLTSTLMGGSSVCGGLVMLVWLTGWGGLCGIVTVFALLFVSARLSRVVKRTERLSLSCGDERLQRLKQLIIGIKAVKLSSWEEPWVKKILQSRNEESKHLRKYRILVQIQMQLGRTCPILGATVCFLFVGLTNPSWAAEDIFAALSVWNAMRQGLIMIPSSVANYAAFMAANDRIRTFLLQPELQRPCASLDGPELKDVMIQWIPGEIVLQGLRFTVEKGLTGVAGAVGSGKTSFLLTLLGELPAKGVVRAARVAYVPQMPIIVVGTVVENVLMGRQWDAERLAKSFQAAALDADLKLLPYGAETQIGERGVLLSGGQQMRVALARAFYDAESTLIADDPLAAVDVEVAVQIFTALKARPVAIVAMNQPHFLQQCDRVVLLNHGHAELIAHPNSQCLKDVAVPFPVEVETTREEAAPDLAPLQSASLATLIAYIQGMGYRSFIVACFFALTTYAAMAGADRILAKWISSGESEAVNYMAMCATFLVCAVSSSLLLAIGGVRAGQTMHKDCLLHLIHAPLSWMEQTPSGRITSRFSSDLANVDVFLPLFFDHVVQFITTLMALIVVVVLVVPPLSLLMLVGLLVFAALTRAVERAMAECKRLAVNSMAPVLTHLQETVSGNCMLRAMDAEAFTCARYDHAVALYCQFSYTSTSIINFGMLCSYTMTVLLSTGTALTVFLLQKSGEEKGLAIAYAVNLPYFLLYFSFVFFNMNLYLACLERLLQYRGTQVPQEPQWYCKDDARIKTTSHGGGALDFEAVELRYRPELEPAVRSLSLHIHPGEKLGIVGRSGAGKSSIVQLLFRLRDASAGRICLDGHDIAHMGLQTLRQRFAIIPQEPLLISGDVRHNVDPFNALSEADFLSVLAAVGLEADLGRDTAKLSAGEAQLVTLARGLLRSVIVAVMDEPTARVDPDTDAKVQRAVRERWQDTTILTIAHRLHTIIDYDRVAVMAHGKLMECASPSILLANPVSEFSALASALGDAAAAKLRAAVGVSDNRELVSL